MNNKTTIMQVLGSLMRTPQLLSEIDKYSLTPYDFQSTFEKYIFIAIDSLYKQGAKKISPIDVENFLETNSTGQLIFKESNGIEYLNDAAYLSDENNFPYYYNKLKKINLLRDFNKMGIDTSDFYIENELDEKAIKVNKEFENLTIEDIIGKVKVKLLKVEKEYSKGERIQSWNLADEIDEVIDNFGSVEEIGLPINGKIVSTVINGAELGALTIRSACSGLGKAIPNYTVIPTPLGNKKVSDIKVGDYLWGDDGKPTKVIGVHPQKEEKEIYLITFKDGRKAECCGEHLWSVYNYYAKNKKQLQTYNTEYLYNQILKNKSGGYHYSIPLNKKIEYPEKVLYPLPYTMGALLGDGSFRYTYAQKALQFSGEDEEIVNKIAGELGADYKKNSEFNFSWTFKTKEVISNRRNLWVEEILKNYPALWNLKSNEKFIPEDYMNSSIEQRLELLRGLLDTDGTIDSKGRITYFTNSYIMAQQVQELCWSLGYIANIAEDSHKSTSIVYMVHIQCDSEEKVKLFYLSRKKERAEKYNQSNKRKERRDNNAIVSIKKTGRYTEMTCFTVDNSSHLFLMNDYIVTHNTRLAVADACKLAFPFYYDLNKNEWVKSGNSEPTLFIMTEQKPEQIMRMVLAYLSGIEENRFRFANFTDSEKQRIKVAKKIIKEFNTLKLMRIPDPTIELIKISVREEVMVREIKYVFFDYIFISPGVLNEFRGHGLRNDEVLLLMATALKDLAIEQNVSVFTSTQVNANADNNTNIRNESSLAGGRATINKADNGMIAARPTKDEIEILSKEGNLLEGNIPNIVFDIFKVRSGRWTQIRIWSIFDTGTLRLEDLFVTDSRMNIIENFFNELYYVSWDMTPKEAEVLKEINNDRV